tara:strand:+ start:86 stop:355 length:270 start_codon:yes stop_codon:yes gene_type:complete
MNTIELLTKYSAPWNEESLAKGIPIKYLKQVQAGLLFGDFSDGLTGFRYMFRGGPKYKTSANKTGYSKRPQAFCHKAMADTFAIYKRSL